jgi:hypothetical protein
MVSYKIWSVLKTGTNKPELPEIILETKRSYATELVGQDCHLD